MKVGEKNIKGIMAKIKRIFLLEKNFRIKTLRSRLTQNKHKSLISSSNIDIVTLSICPSTLYKEKSRLTQNKHKALISSSNIDNVNRSVCPSVLVQRK